MPQPPPEDPPTRQVERIREILVGRQMQAVEQRLARLERQVRPMPVDTSHADAEHSRQLDALRRDLDERDQQQREEIQRLSRRIQDVARERREIAEDARLRVEHHLHPWLQRWRAQLHDELEARETHLITELRAELDRLRDQIRRQLPADPDAYRDALERFAEAARALAEQVPSRS